jgi:pilus assembly protein CpaF
MTKNENSSTPTTEREELKTYLSERMHRQLMKGATGTLSRDDVVGLVEDEFAKIETPLGEDEKKKFFAEIAGEFTSYGPLQIYLDDPEISEIMVNGHRKVYVERDGQLELTTVKFNDNQEVELFIQRLVKPLGYRINSRNPAIDARLPDGSRISAIIPPVAIDGPTITISKFSADSLGMQDLVDNKSISEAMADLLEASVEARLNILISGGTGAGKSNLLNTLAGFIPAHERIVAIEDSGELQFKQEHVVRLETKPADSSGSGGMTTRDLVRNALRMRPDRILVGEVRGSEALDLLRAMNNGYDGSLTTLHANSPRDGVSRLETLCMTAGMDIPLATVQRQIASAVDIVIQVSRLADGTRKVTHITEVSGMEGEKVVMADIFRYEQSGTSASGKVRGAFVSTGIRPLFVPRLEAAGFRLPASMFVPAETQSPIVVNVKKRR